MVLIETYWNVNFDVILVWKFSRFVLIETYWNVNTGARPSSTYRHWLVLIETYWNVNCQPIHVPCASGGVLIETYWNVNWYLNTENFTATIRINRNILECKF